MLKRPVLILILIAAAFVAAHAQTAPNTDTVMILPFENTSDKAEFNWVGESFADSLADLLKVPGLNVISNSERKTIQQRLRVPLTSIPSLATSLKLARESKATLLVFGKYNIVPSEGEAAASLTVTARVIRVNEGRFLSEERSDGKLVTNDINLTDALGNLQTLEGQIAYRIHYYRDRGFFIKMTDLIESAKKIPARAFEAYIKGLLTSAPEARENYFKNAMRLYSEISPESIYADAALELGHFYLSQRRYSEAIEYFSQTVSANVKCKDRSKAETKMAFCDDESFAEASFYIGLIQWQQGNYEPALSVLRPLADDLKLISVYNTLGAIAVQASRAEKKNQAKAAGLLTEGQELLKKAADSAPNELNVKFNYGATLFFNGNFQEAIPVLKEVIAGNQRDGEAYYLLAKALESQKDPLAAEMDNQARRFLTDNNKYANFEKEWAKSRSVPDIKLRVEQPARKDFVSVVLINKQGAETQTPVDETEALLVQARNFYKGGNDNDAMVILRRVLSSEPMSAESYLLLGKIHLRQGDIDQAISSFKTAIFWDNRLIDAHISLGKIYLEKRDCLQAKNYAASAEQIGAENQEVMGLKRQVEKCSK